MAEDKKDKKRKSDAEVAKEDKGKRSKTAKDVAAGDKEPKKDHKEKKHKEKKSKSDKADKADKAAKKSESKPEKKDAAEQQRALAAKAQAIAETLEQRYERRLGAVDVIAKPMAPRSEVAAVYETVRAGAQSRSLSRGVGEVVKALRKGRKGFVVIAGDISPIDVITHIPVFCEENKVPYIFVPSKEDLGIACATKRPSSCVMVSDKLKTAAGRSSLYQSTVASIEQLHQTMSM